MPPKRLGPLGRLSCGESLLISRRRQQPRVTQHDAGRRCAATRSTYGKWERDVEQAPDCTVGRLRAYERCLLYRRRAKLSQDEVARGLGRSRWWVNQMERGVVRCDEIVYDRRNERDSEVIDRKNHGKVHGFSLRCSEPGVGPGDEFSEVTLVFSSERKG